jgi:hypothetical protein
MEVIVAKGGKRVGRFIWSMTRRRNAAPVSRAEPTAGTRVDRFATSIHQNTGRVPWKCLIVFFTTAIALGRRSEKFHQKSNINSCWLCIHRRCPTKQEDGTMNKQLYTIEQVAKQCGFNF